MIIEFFGLSSSGKSVFKRKITKKGFRTFQQGEISFLTKIFFFIKHFLFHPASTIYLFGKLNTNKIKIKGLSLSKRLKIWRLRNFYLMFVLAKHEFFKNKKQKIFTDEFALQSLFMILHKKSNKAEILEILKNLPKSKAVFLFDGNKKLRYDAYENPHPLHVGATLLPGSFIDKKFAKQWMKTMEYNFDIVKKIIQESYKQDQKAFKGINVSYPEIYLKK